MADGKGESISGEPIETDSHTGDSYVKNPDGSYGRWVPPLQVATPDPHPTFAGLADATTTSRTDGSRWTGGQPQNVWTPGSETQSAWDGQDATDIHGYGGHIGDTDYADDPDDDDEGDDD